MADPNRASLASICSYMHTMRLSVRRRRHAVTPSPDKWKHA